VLEQEVDHHDPVQLQVDREPVLVGGAGGELPEAAGDELAGQGLDVVLLPGVVQAGRGDGVIVVGGGGVVVVWSRVVVVCEWLLVVVVR